ncbi:hypothetical protein [uncultured Enorma sp.]|uniref:hypothetical protein n=1 Tax=uncultured Enorma sp. TaxID=1714346 RepID=UPI002629D10D|nr:hypothetical protein [uncultured Enorma sp.]
MMTTNRVVYKPVKVDFHIHSASSSNKDGMLVKGGTAQNIDVLFRKLEDNHVNMTAITDHDCFDLEVYDALRKKVDEAEYLQCVLPGVEFTVRFATTDGDKPVHVITIFDDSKPELVEKIGQAIEVHRTQYYKNGSFSEDEYWSIIRGIGLDIVTIAHQKNSPSSATRKPNDANSVGEDLFNEFLFLDYFEAYEYRNRRNELFNKSFSRAYTSEEQKQLRFITGSDCHVWDAYPSHDNQSKPSDVNFSFSYLKCLPTFRGLVMAVTDITRIKTVPSLFSGSSKVLGSIDLTLNGANVSVPLSPGINAIIGDNSIGKSSLLNALTEYREVKATVRRGQEGYLEKMGLSVQSIIPACDLLQFDGQDSIRSYFEGLSSGKAKRQLDKHFPEAVDPAPFRDFAMGQFRKFMAALKDSCEYQSSVSSLADYTLPKSRPLDAPESVTFERDLALDDATPHIKLNGELDTSLVQLSNIEESYPEILGDKDRDDLQAARAALKRIRHRHKLIVNEAAIEKLVSNKVLEAVTEREKMQSKVITDAQRSQANYQLAISNIGKTVAAAVKQEKRLRPFSFSFEPMVITPSTNPVGSLQFICKLGVDKITPYLLSSLLDGLIGKSKDLDTLSSSYQDVIDAIKNYPDDEEDPLSVLEERFKKALDTKLKPVKSINREDDDVYEELSRGYNSQMYFALMADRSVGDGIYIVDQPEDQISQKAIRESVLGEFRDIASARQVILITHNPQFIVNLDVDNVIFIGKKDGKLNILSGALEYVCPDYGMLDIVAENIEGGLDTIQRRMKRYEKAS